MNKLLLKLQSIKNKKERTKEQKRKLNIISAVITVILLLFMAYGVMLYVG